MTLTITPNPDISRLLVAGRRAALAALYDQERNRDVPGSIDSPPEAYDGTSAIVFTVGTEADIGPAIDAAVLEVVVQIDNPEPRRRAWWRFWR